MSLRVTIRPSSLMAYLLVTAYISSQPSIVGAKEKHTADVQVVNKTGHDIEFVTIAHKYSDDYKNSKTWGNLRTGGVTKEPLQAEYNTGFLTTGRDWWIVTWKYKGDETIYVTNPKNLRSLVDAMEQFAGKVLPLAGEVVGSIVGGDDGGTVGSAAAAALGSLLLNSESTVGFKQHILREEDSRERNARPTIIEIGEKEVRFSSSSGDSSTGFTEVKKK